MKYNIDGYNQQKLIDLGLDCIDAIILRWYADFQLSGNMAENPIEGKVYYWLKYEYVIQELPITGIENKESIFRRFKKFVDAGIMEHKTKRCVSGTYSCFRLTDKYYALISNYTTGTEQIDSKVGCKSTQKSIATDSKVEPKDSSINDSSINDNIYASAEAISDSEDLKEMPPEKKETELCPFIEHWNTISHFTKHQPGTKRYKNMTMLFRDAQQGVFGRKNSLDRDYMDWYGITDNHLRQKWASEQIIQAIDNYAQKFGVEDWKDWWPTECDKFLFNPRTGSSFFFANLVDKKEKFVAEIKDQTVYNMYRRELIRGELNRIEEKSLIRNLNFVVNRQEEYHEKIGQYFTPALLKDKGFYKSHIDFLRSQYFDKGVFDIMKIGSKTVWSNYIIWLKNRGTQYNLEPNEKEIRIAKENFVERERKMRERENEEREERKEPRIITRNRWQLQEATG